MFEERIKGSMPGDVIPFKPRPSLDQQIKDLQRIAAENFPAAQKIICQVVKAYREHEADLKPPLDLLRALGEVCAPHPTMNREYARVWLDSLVPNLREIAHQNAYHGTVASELHTMLDP
jgi:hypothetical protein